MALFKILRGNANNLPVDRHDGWAYFTTDTHEFFIDYTDSDGNPQRASITTPRMIPRLSSNGTYYFENLITPIFNATYLNCGNSVDITTVDTITYNAGDSTDFNYTKILQSV